MTEIPHRIRRRWLRFSLRTLFVLLTALAIPLSWLGWQVRIVQARQAFLRDRNPSIGGHDVNGGRPCQISFYRVWLGDQPIDALDVQSEADMPDAVRLFPEANWIMPPLPPDFKLSREAARQRDAANQVDDSRIPAAPR